MPMVPATTRALVYDRYGRPEVLQFRDVPLGDPGRGDVVVRVAAAALNPKDALVRRGKFRLWSGSRFPKRVGLDLVGTACWVGPRVRGIAPGDRVFGALEEIRCLRGTLAHFVIARGHEVATAPAGLGDLAAAALPLAGATALQALRDLGGTRNGDRVCLHGASGGVGSFAIQIAKLLGAHVTTTSSAGNREMCLSLGADEALDYATDDPLRVRSPYRTIFDVHGGLGFGRARGALAPEGTYVSTVPSAGIVRDWIRTLASRQRARLVVVRTRRADLETLAAWAVAGSLRPVIQQSFPFEAAVDAIRSLETWHTRGKLVVEVATA